MGPLNNGNGEAIAARASEARSTGVQLTEITIKVPAHLGLRAEDVEALVMAQVEQDTEAALRRIFPRGRDA
jgi:hypothetical protein